MRENPLHSHSSKSEASKAIVIPPYLRPYAYIVGIVLIMMAVSRIFTFVSAARYEAKDAEVKPANCYDETCARRGTLRIDPWTSDYLLETSDGKVIRIGKAGFNAIVVPRPQVSDKAP